MKQNRYMRLIVFFDLPQETKEEKRRYLRFKNFLARNGYIMIQYSVYVKLCINIHTLNTQKNKLLKNAPTNGDIRYLAISEKQYLGIKDINNKYSLQEKVITEDRLIIIGDINDI